MRCLVKLFTTQSRASDNSLIPRRVVEEYLSSPGYKMAIERGLMVGGRSHRDRVLKASPNGELLSGVVGKDDNLLLNNNSISVIDKIFFNPDDPNDEWVYAIQRFFDPEDMDDASAKAIKQITGMIKNGVKISTSAVVIGYWNEDEVCEKLIGIKGNDITLNPAFSKSGQDPAGIVKVIDD